MVVFDTSFLALAFDAQFKAPVDPETGEVMEDCKARISQLVELLSEQKVRILVPTPVLAEYLVRAGLDREKRLTEFTASRAFSVAPFDTRAAVECALLSEQELKAPSLQSEEETRAKVKFDRQIIAIAKARNTARIYTGDRGLANCAKRNGLAVTMTWELPKPTMIQQPLELG